MSVKFSNKAINQQKELSKIYKNFDNFFENVILLLSTTKRGELGEVTVKSPVIIYRYLFEIYEKFKIKIQIDFTYQAEIKTCQVLICSIKIFSSSNNCIQIIK